MVDIINADARATQLVKQGVKPSAIGGKSHRGARLLLRPIIAICNDAYAPSLRTLRPLAEVVAYRKVSPLLVADRLRAVCAAEKLKIDTRTLTQIANESDSDMRSCLNILQFGVNSQAAAGGGGAPSDQTKMAIAPKDREKSWTSVVNRIFRRQRGFNSKTEESASVLADIHSCGEYDRLVTSCFTMYPEMHFHDDMFQKPVRFGDWCYFHDMVARGIYVNQHGALAEYYAYAPLACFSFFSSYNNVGKDGRRDLIVKTGLEHRETQRMNEQLLDEFMEYASPACRQSFTRAEVPSELLPFLLRLVNPSLDPSSSTMPSSSGSFSGGGSRGGGGKKNEAKVAAIADILVAYNLSLHLRQVDPDRGTSAYCLAPPLETLVAFGDTAQAALGVGKFSTRAAIAAELNRRRYEARSGENANGNVAPYAVKRYKASEAPAAATDSSNDTGPRKRKHTDLADDPSNSTPKAEPADPFQRFKKVTTIIGTTGAAGKVNHELEQKLSQVQTAVAATANAEKVWVQFNEGLSNAVRRNISWRDVWL